VTFREISNIGRRHDKPNARSFGADLDGRNARRVTVDLDRHRNLQADARKFHRKNVNSGWPCLRVCEPAQRQRQRVSGDAKAGTRVGPAGYNCDYTLQTHFANDSANLVDAADKAELDRLAAVMTNPKLQFVAGEIDGYTDNVGDAAYNEKLSKERAEAVANYLKSKGVVLGDRFTTKGFGAADPIADNNTEEGRAKNRRVTIRRTDCGPAL